MLAEAYLMDEKIMPINTVFIAPEKVDKFELFQNKPNPFTNQTIIPFYLPKTEIIDLKIMDSQGRNLQRITRKYDKGMHEIIIDKRAVPATGLLYYQLTDGKTVLTKKMLLLE